MMEFEDLDHALRDELADRVAGIRKEAVSLIDSELHAKLARAYADIRERDAVIHALHTRIADLEQKITATADHQDVPHLPLLVQVKQALPEPVRTTLRPVYRLAKRAVGRG
ncbi:hypothetical protein INS90_08225 [Trueperella pecoris]|uniref:Uncharacterized protein n=1 Tax=Trueperella pecoris TaxID=2733571 RepID=A0A7M1QYT2_9ACTO|nr:hypothetical protein [Trueperella pecoris]QOR47242.1 hypothetical protein INS90_08225 [Trueperella pecoris]